jgi:type I restriction enzyme S subunit
MTSEWRKVKISEIIEIIGGGTPKTSVPEYWNGSIPWLSVADFNNVPRWVTSTEKHITKRGLEESSAKLLSAGDIIISARGTVGAIAQLTRPMTFNQSCYGIRGIEGISKTDYVFYTLKFVVEQLKRLAHGAVFDTITRDTFNTVDVLLPSLNEQNQIASLLGVLDDRITLLRDTNSTLEAIAQALFKSWFVSFDPVRAKAEGSLPEGIDAVTAALFPDAFEDSELGLVPKGWAFQTLGDLLVPKRGKSITKNKCVEGDIPVVAGGLKPAYFHNQSNVSSPVVTISASGANAGFVRLYQQDIWASDCSFVSAEQTDAIYFWYVFLKFNQEKIYFMQQGAAQPHIYPSDLMRLYICSPQTDKLRGIFNSLVSPLFDRIGLNNTTIQMLSNLRDTLLPRLISGQLRINDAEIELEKAIA